MRARRTTAWGQVSALLSQRARHTADAAAQTHVVSSWAALTVLAAVRGAPPPRPPPPPPPPPPQRDVRDAAAGTRDDAAPCDAAVQTAVELPQSLPSSAFDGWWARLVQHAADEALPRTVPAAALPRLLALVPQVYAEKAAADRACTREGAPPVCLASCLHAHFLRAEGTAAAAHYRCVAAVADLMGCLRAQSYPSLEPPPTDQSESPPPLGDGWEARAESAFAAGVAPGNAGVGLDYGAKSGLYECVRRRLALFARFLGLPVDGSPALPEYAAHTFLSLLVRARAGVVPQLPSCGERVAVPARGFLRALDHSLESGGAVRSVERERLKALVASEAALSGAGSEPDRLDLERALEVVVGVAIEVNQVCSPWRKFRHTVVLCFKQ